MKHSSIRDFVSQIPLPDLQKICENFDVLEKRGVIGNCLLRQYSRIYEIQTYGDDGSRPSETVRIMRNITFEAWRQRALLAEEKE